MIRVLIADDQRVVREGLDMVLGLIQGIEVVGTAADGEEAVRRAVARAGRRPHGPADARSTASRPPAGWPSAPEVTVIALTTTPTTSVLRRCGPAPAAT